MVGLPNTQTGRAMLISAVLVLALALWMSLGDGRWLDASLYYALAIVFACYGALLSEVAPRWNRLLVIVGLLAGVVAFGMAVVGSW